MKMTILLSGAVMAATLAITPSGLVESLVIHDPFFGWGAHALCLGAGWAAVVLPVLHLLVAALYFRIPSVLRSIRGRLDSESSKLLISLEMFILACGVVHAFQAVATYAPTMSALVMIALVPTVYLSAKAVGVLRALGHHAFSRIDALDDEIKRARSSCGVGYSSMVAEAARLGLRLESISNALKTDLLDGAEAVSKAASATGELQNLIEVLQTIVEEHPDPVVVYNMSNETIVVGSEHFWHMMGREAARDIAYLPLVSIDDREEVHTASKTRPLADEQTPYVDVKFTKADGEIVVIRHHGGFIESSTTKGFAWCRTEAVR